MNPIPAWVLAHPLYYEWLRISISGVGMDPGWRESPERFIREVIATLGKPPGLSEKEWQAKWIPPPEEPAAIAKLN